MKKKESAAAHASCSAQPCLLDESIEQSLLDRVVLRRVLRVPLHADDPATFELDRLGDAVCCPGDDREPVTMRSSA